MEHLILGTKYFLFICGAVGGILGLVGLLYLVVSKCKLWVSIAIIILTLFFGCVAVTYAAQLYNYEVYYPNTCTFMNGKVEISGQGIYRNYYYQVMCKEGGDISTYVSAPMAVWQTPARVNHIPSNIRGYIYVKEIK